MMSPVCTTCGKEKLGHIEATGLTPSPTQCDAWCPGFFLDPVPLDRLPEPYVVNVFANPGEVRVSVKARRHPFASGDVVLLARKLSEAANIIVQELQRGG